ncbi:ABC transporter permease [Lutispora saccharofermentans]|uniref:ABC transporter permease n=1 Tax=Lutispora saccharofermentans TaxID=3024236 RepID=A0ABT1NCX8_9FIRM|nr:ABC transporter permease [Lutispora saccharofermentans]MCQ1529107.1 ABC transporter permease [Lutispora saccharofermentans]
MVKYILKRIIQSIPLLLLITIISFLIINLAPGDPAAMFINPEKMTKVDIETIRHNLGLDKPLHIRYILWLKNMLKGDLGISFFKNRPVTEILMEALPNTIVLSIAATLLSIVIAIPAGIISALKRNTGWDYTFSTISFVGVSIPSFWFALMLLLVFGAKLGWLPIGGMRTNYEEFVLADRLRHLILPTIVLGFGNMATDMRYMRSAMLEVIRQDYIKTARSKGLAEKVVIFKHALRNALLPLITLFGFMIPGLIGGAAITESIFAWPGIGRIVVEANFTRDYPIIMGELVFTAVLVVLGSLIADVLYAIADPRIKYD